MNDYSARQEALNPVNSYIVQAPAGSGKTTLLTQRFLKLLTCVDEPESIIALTFTQKAAAEMRERVLLALENCETDELKKIAHQLLQSPHRLRIQTIDSLCFELVSKMPLLSQGIPYASIAEDSITYYQEAAERCLTEGFQDTQYQSSIETLLLHLGNYYTRCVDLLSDMLKWRDQWLPLIMSTQSFSISQLKDLLEQALKNLKDDAITHLNTFLSQEIRQELQILCEYASANKKNNSDDFFNNISTLLLTQDNTWRSRIDKNMGFPAPSESKNSEEKSYFQNMKERLQILLSNWRDNPHHSEPLRLALENYRLLPPTQYSDTQWKILEALFTLLPFLAAQLNVIFMESGKIDFTEIAAQASEALGQLDEPSDLALKYDYRIQHLLIDEFQDTSFKQFRLIEKLTQGWQPDDGRTLFIVGDPMQSIYRFREAEVGLFLKAREAGIGAITLKSLTLTSNFRSYPELITWINTCFSTIFPAEDELHLGAVKYHSSQAGRDSYDGSGKIQFYTQETPEQQGKNIVALIKTIPTHQSIALLIRSRAQLRVILPYFQEANIPFQGIDIDSLATRPYIQDLYALTQTLLEPANVLAWYGVLRAPWCGLKLADLWALSQQQNKTPIDLSEDGQKRFQKIQAIISRARHEKGKKALSLWVENTWRALGGHLCVNENTQQDIEAFWELLDTQTYTQFNLTQNLLEKIQTLFSKTTQESHCHIMTIHKSKGLEFDHVILPHLESLPSRKDAPLLQHMERQTPKKHNDWLLAGIKSIDASEDSLYEYLQYINDKKESFERQRLLYVALTRARSQLHLFAINKDKNNKTPTKNSFLYDLMPHLPEAIYEQYEEIAEKTKRLPKLRRLKSAYFEDEKFPLPLIVKDETTTEISTYGRNSPIITTIGTFIHEHIQFCAEKKLTTAPLLNLDTLKARLIELGMYTEPEQQHALHLTQQALNNLYNDPCGQWILNPAHHEAKNEFAINYGDKTAILDRTFFDSSQNQHWIIDYKITHDPLPSGTLSLEFAPEEYRAQLEHYAVLLKNLLNKTTQEKISLGLYYPLTKTLITWQV